MSFLRRASGLSLRQRVRCLVVREALSGDAASQPRENVGGIWLGNIPGTSDWEETQTDQRHVGQTMCLYWPGNALGFHQRNWPKCLGRGNFGTLCLDCCPDGRTDRQLRN